MRILRNQKDDSKNTLIKIKKHTFQTFCRATDYITTTV